MSIIGTRPPLISETNFYELHHRARLAIKPGITGMWQVSGRSDIPQRQNRSRENKWKALCGNYVGGVLGVPHGLLSGGVLLIKMFDKL